MRKYDSDPPCTARSPGTDNEASQLYPCGRAPLQCALATLAEVKPAFITDPRGSPACCLTIATKETAQLAESRRMAILTFAAVGEILLALRDDEKGRTTAAHCIANATVALENFIASSKRRAKIATARLRHRYGRDACPACGDDSDLRAAVEQLRWCESMLNQSRRGSNG
jgi:hypothetical protein